MYLHEREADDDEVAEVGVVEAEADEVADEVTTHRHHLFRVQYGMLGIRLRSIAVIRAIISRVLWFQV